MDGQMSITWIGGVSTAKQEENFAQPTFMQTMKTTRQKKVTNKRIQHKTGSDANPQMQTSLPTY